MPAPPAGDSRPDLGRVFLVRHGRTTLNDQGRLRGRLDPPLDDVGRAEALDVAAVLAPDRPVRVVCSPLARAVETAETIAARAGVTASVDERLADRDYGDWAGHEPREVLSRYGSYDEAPGVESSEDVTKRALAVLDEQIPRLGEGVIVLVAHDAVNGHLLHALDPGLGEPDEIEQHTGCWNLIERRGDSWSVERVNQHS